MAARKDEQTIVRTRIARLRVENGLSQAAVAYAIGLPLSSYRKLERGNQWHPDLCVLVNLSILYEVPLETLLEPAWLEWTPGFGETYRPQPLPLAELRGLSFHRSGARIE